MMFSAIVGLAILGLGFAIVVIEISDPEADTGLLAHTLTGMVAGILGALLGLIAGRGAAVDDLHKRPDDESNGL